VRVLVLVPGQGLGQGQVWEQVLGRRLSYRHLPCHLWELLREEHLDQ
jgi:hypothetical protein